MSPKAAQVVREIAEYYRDRPVEEFQAFRDWMREAFPHLRAAVAPAPAAGLI